MKRNFIVMFNNSTKINTTNKNHLLTETFECVNYLQLSIKHHHHPISLPLFFFFNSHYNQPS